MKRDRLLLLGAGVVALTGVVAACVGDAGVSGTDVGDSGGGGTDGGGNVLPGVDGSSSGMTDGGGGGKDAGASSTCEAGAADCQGNVPRACVGGTWQAQPACPGLDAGTPLCFNGACVATLSCAPPAAPGAGPTCAGGDNCCASLVVPGGTFNRRSDSVFSEAIALPATVSAFHLDKYEVTVGRFRRFVEAGLGTQASPPADGVGAHPKIAGSGWRKAWNGNLPVTTALLKTQLGSTSGSVTGTWTDAPGTSELKPIANISFELAFAFCAWDGGRLPTDAEWSFAEAGGNAQRTFAWGNTFDEMHATQKCNYASPAGACTPDDLPNVGTFPLGVGMYGQMDLTSSLDEWTFDTTIDPNPPVNSVPKPWLLTPCTDCGRADPPDAATKDPGHYVRGGDYALTAIDADPNGSTQAPRMRTSDSLYFQRVGGYFYPTFGIRCARDY